MRVDGRRLQGVGGSVRRLECLEEWRDQRDCERGGGSAVFEMERDEMVSS